MKGYSQQASGCVRREQGFVLMLIQFSGRLNRALAGCVRRPAPMNGIRIVHHQYEFLDAERPENRRLNPHQTVRRIDNRMAIQNDGALRHIAGRPKSFHQKRLIVPDIDLPQIVMPNRTRFKRIARVVDQRAGLKMLKHKRLGNGAQHR